MQTHDYPVTFSMLVGDYMIDSHRDSLRTSFWINRGSHHCTDKHTCMFLSIPSCKWSCFFFVSVYFPMIQASLNDWGIFKLFNRCTIEPSQSARVQRNPLKTWCRPSWKTNDGCWCIAELCSTLRLWRIHTSVEGGKHASNDKIIHGFSHIDIQRYLKDLSFRIIHRCA